MKIVHRNSKMNCGVSLHKRCARTGSVIYVDFFCEIGPTHSLRQIVKTLREAGSHDSMFHIEISK